MNWTRVEGLWSLQGWIYGLYHLASGRWYVGQTIRQIWVRGREHWNQRKTCHDMLHQALSNELTPFAFVIIPLEKIPNWQYFSPQRDETRRLFRQFATPRERYWTGRINSLWPQGFNSAFPGFPVSAWRRRVWRVPEKDSLELHEEEVNEVGRQVSSWLQRLRKEGSSALLELKKWDKFKLRETLDWIQRNVPAAERKANLIAVETTLIDELKDRRARPPKRHFLKFHFGNKAASFLLLRNVLRELFQAPSP